MGIAARLDVYLVRHGITQWNREKRYLGQTDEPVIKERLERDFDVLKDKLAALEQPFLVSSDLLRCRQTMACLFPGTAYAVDARLREFDFGDWEGKTYEELKDDRRYREWIDDWRCVDVPAGESAGAFAGRIRDWWQAFLEEVKPVHSSTGSCVSKTANKSAVVVTHGGVIRFLIAMVLEREDEFWKWHISHGEAVQVSLILDDEGGTWRCSSLSAVPMPEKEK